MKYILKKFSSFFTTLLKDFQFCGVSDLQIKLATFSLSFELLQIVAPKSFI